jgi:hypothetical protein
MVYALIWILLCPAVAASIHARKGRSALTGLLVGLFLGPIGVLLALLSGTDATGVEQRQIASGQARKCVKCAELIKHDALVCRYCGMEYVRAPVAAVTK